MLPLPPPPRREAVKTDGLLPERILLIVGESQPLLGASDLLRALGRMLAAALVAWVCLLVGPMGYLHKCERGVRWFEDGGHYLAGSMAVVAICCVRRLWLGVILAAVWLWLYYFVLPPLYLDWVHSGPPEQ
ncbi:MAG: hypothetical protein L0Z62_06840 [Gemmataceae bacterium]|nr:hypothetical protein [Gemmataceae bacterium]